MALVNNKWRVTRGDSLWSIAKTVYNNAYKWKDIANSNGIKQSNPIIYVGQNLILPGITPGSGSGSSSSTPKTTESTNGVTYQWFALDADTERNMFATWTCSKSHVNHYEIHWEYDKGDGAGWRVGEYTTSEQAQDGYNADSAAKRVKLSVKPISDTYTKNNKDVYYWTDGEWTTKEYNFSDNPPSLPPNPTISIDTYNTLTVTFENISEDINADSIEIAIYQNDTTKYSSVKVTINSDARFASYTGTVPAGYNYKVRCRAVRGTIYGGWTDFTSNELSCPNSPSEITTLRPQVISEQMSKTYGVFAEWPEVTTASTYELQWVTNLDYFEDPTKIQSQSTEEGQGPRLLISDLEVGHEYFFRVRSVNNKGYSQYWSEVKSVVLGTKPSAPTTWSNTSSCVIGEDLNLYWVHNSTDYSYESYARLNIKVIDSLNPSAQPLEYTKVITNDRPEEDKNKTSVYTINTSSAEWSLVKAGYIIKWKVQTSGITDEYSDWSVEREVNVYAKPELELDIKNQDGESISEINSFPFYISVLAKPAAQVPISYYVEVVANQGYETVDNVGNKKVVNPGDKVYQKYYDPETNAWSFIVSMNPGNIDLQNDINYTVNCTVSMNSGLTATSSESFDVYFNDIFYDISAEIVINSETLEASINPYCKEFYEEDGETKTRLTDDCTLSVYRKEYDGTFTEIATGIDNEMNLFVVDPHPSLDYARYRVVAKSNDTGSISYADIPAVKFGEPSVVIQWSEKWVNYTLDDQDTGMIEPPWAGSLIKIPYNIDISESNSIDVSLIEYAGRRHPVSYYGTQLGVTSTWNVEIPKDDKETLYGIRRLSIWTGDVYVREPSGIGYWANISVSYNVNHSDLTIPITFNIRRVEGGM